MATKHEEISHVLKKVGEPVIVEIEALPVDILLIRSAPDGDKD